MIIYGHIIFTPLFLHIIFHYPAHSKLPKNVSNYVLFADKHLLMMQSANQQREHVYSPKGPDGSESFSGFWEVAEQRELGTVIKFLEVPRKEKSHASRLKDHMLLNQGYFTIIFVFVFIIISPSTQLTKTSTAYIWERKKKMDT